MRFKKNNICIILIISMILSIVTPFTQVRANKLDDLIKFKWQRNSGYSNVNKLREDSIPIIDNEGNTYIVDRYGYLNCIRANRELKYEANIYQSVSDSCMELGGSSPVIDSKLNAYIASNDKNIYAFNANGIKKWKYTMDSKVAISMKGVLSPKEDVVYMADTNGRVYAINTNDGSLVWKTERYMGYGCTSPTLSNDGKILYIASGSSIIAFNTTKEKLHDDKRIKWRTSIDEDNYFYYMNANSGCQYEKIPSADEEGNLYAVSMVFCNRKFYLHKFSKEGNEQWKIEIGGTDVDSTPPIYYKGYLYYKTSENKLVKLNPKDKQPVPKIIFQPSNESFLGRRYAFREKPIIVEGKLYINFGKNIYVIDLDTEKLLRKSSFSGTDLVHISKPTLKGDIYASNGITKLLKFNDTTVKQIPSTIEFENKNFVMRKDGIYTPKFNVKDVNGYNIGDKLNVVLKSDNENVIKVKDNFLKAVGVGNANVTAIVEGIKTSAQVQVVKDLSLVNIKIKNKNVSLSPQQKFQIEATATIDGKSLKGENIIFTSRHEKIASVSSSGLVTGISKGIAKIEAHVKNKSTFIPVYVSNTDIKQVEIKEIKHALTKSIEYYKKRNGVNDWGAFTVNAIGVDVNAVDNTYVSRMKSILKNKKGVAGSLMTDYERMCIGLISVGQDITHFVYDDETGAYIDFIKEIRNGASGGITQGINAVIWGLIALNSADYDENKYVNTIYSKEFFIDYILKNKSGDGWAFGSGASADPDMTGMALYALAPYRNRQDVKEAGEKAIKWLSESAQLPSGKFGTFGTINSCSTSQTIMGITAWGIDPQGKMFTKANGNAVTALMTYYLGDGTFAHTSGYDPGFGTPQGIQALSALKDYYESNKDSLKRRSDIWENIQYAKECNGMKIKSISIGSGDLILPCDENIKLIVITDIGDEIKNSKLKWLSSNNGIVTVENGNLNTLKKGEAFITAEYKLEDGTIKKHQIKVTVTSNDEFEMVENLNSTITGLGNKMYAFNVTNKTDKNIDAVFMVNLFQYNKEMNTDKLVQQVYVKMNFDPNKPEEMAVAFDIPKDNKEYNVKVMLWDDLSTARSLKNALEIKEAK